jgi:hypothetical protein
MRARLPLTILALGLVVTPSLAAAQSGRLVSAADLARDARRYLEQPITLRDAYCFAADRRYQCMTTEPLRIVLETMPAGPAKSAMDTECGELDGLEQSPTCRFTLQIVPTEAKTETGTFVRNKRAMRGRITVVTATVIAARRE